MLHPDIILLLGASSWLFWSGIALLRKQRDEYVGAFAFRRINVFMFLVILFLSVDKLFV